MIYRVERKEKPFVLVDKGFINDERLSFKEKGILLYFLSKPDKWEFFEEEIASHSRDGISAVKAGIKKLIECGYIVRGERIRNDKGQLGAYEYIVKEVSTTCENPTQEKPTQEKPTQENHTTSNNNINNNNSSKNDSINTPIVPKGESEDKNNSKTTLMERFETFYKAYPKHKSRGAAEKAWRTLKPTDELLAKIMAGLERAKKSNEWQKENGQYIPYPATWLRAKGWEDEIDDDKTTTQLQRNGGMNSNVPIDTWGGIKKL